MSHFVVVLDADALYHYPLTSVLLELAEARLYRPVWSADIHAEWMCHLQQNRPDIDPRKIDRRRAAMDTALPDACVTGYQKLIPVLTLPDPNDRHVLAVAIRARAQVIVTFNTRHFPDAPLAEFDIAAQHPDASLRVQIDLAPNVVRQRLLAMVEKYRNPPVTPMQYVDTLEHQGSPGTAVALRELLADIRNQRSHRASVPGVAYAAVALGSGTTDGSSTKPCQMAQFHTVLTPPDAPRIRYNVAVQRCTSAHPPSHDPSYRTFYVEVTTPLSSRFGSQTDAVSG